MVTDDDGGGDTTVVLTAVGVGLCGVTGAALEGAHAASVRIQTATPPMYLPRPRRA